MNTKGIYVFDCPQMKNFDDSHIYFLYYHDHIIKYRVLINVDALTYLFVPYLHEKVESAYAN